MTPAHAIYNTIRNSRIAHGVDTPTWDRLKPSSKALWERAAAEGLRIFAESTLAAAIPHPRITPITPHPEPPTRPTETLRRDPKSLAAGDHNP